MSFDYYSLRQGDFEDQIDRATEESTFVLVVLTECNDLERCPKSPENELIIHEVSLAIEYGRIVMPVVPKQNFIICCNVYYPNLYGFTNTGIIFDDEGDDLSRLYRNEHIKELRKGIGKTYHFEFLGVVMDVIAII